MDVVYYSSTSEYTHRFVAKLGGTAYRIPLRKADGELKATKPYLLIVPTYGGDAGERPVLPQIIKFLNDPYNRALIRGVVSCGNRNFGSTFCIAGDLISAKCKVPHLHRVELLGTGEDVEIVQRILTDL